ncbi:MAG: 4Fe-4S binding protein [Dehalococcoidales bacterium]|nr:4Fe-4S binding protein [Dehalococcoidales bacterium]
MVEMPVVEPGKCDGCGLCINVCSCGALVLVDGFIMVVATEGCGWCLQCEIVCPTGAITCPFEIVSEEIKM